MLLCLYVVLTSFITSALPVIDMYEFVSHIACDYLSNLHSDRSCMSEIIQSFSDEQVESFLTVLFDHPRFFSFAGMQAAFEDNFALTIHVESTVIKIVPLDSDIRDCQEFGVPLESYTVMVYLPEIPQQSFFENLTSTENVVPEGLLVSLLTPQEISASYLERTNSITPSYNLSRNFA